MKVLGTTIAALLLFLLAAFPSHAQNTTGGAKGKVRDGRDNGIANVTVTARLDGKDAAKGKTDAKGNFQLNGLKPGKYNFVFEKSGYTGGVKYDVDVAAGEVRDLGDKLVMTVDSGSLVLIRGSVFQEDGRSYANVKVDMFKVLADGTLKKLGTASTNYSGDFGFRQPANEAKLRFTASADGATASKDIDVSTAGIYRLAITLAKNK